MLNTDGMKRLQGNLWRSEREKLTLVEHEKNEKGHVLGIYVNNETGEKFCHWLGDSEIKKLEEGDSKSND